MAGPSIFKRLTDGNLAPMVGPYLQRLLGYYNAGIRRLHKREVMQYWTADMRIDGDALHIGVEPRDQTYFEFFTTGNPIVMGTVTQGNSQLTSAKAACIGVTISVEGDSQPAVKASIRTGARDLSGQNISLVQRPFQVQLINEPVVNQPPKTMLFGRPKYFNSLYRAYAPMHSHTGIHLRSYNKGTNATYGDPGSVTRHRYGTPLDHGTGDSQFGVQLIKYDYTTNLGIAIAGPTSGHMTRDVLFDVPYQDGHNTKPVRDAVLNNGTVDWPRANGVVTIKNAQYGDREFAIYIDAFSQFSVFPTSQIGAANGTVQNVLGKYVTTVKPTLPAWVYQMTQTFKSWYEANATIGLTDFPEIDWRVSHDGSKACAVAYERVASNCETSYFTPDPTGGFNSYRDTYTGWISRYGNGLSGIATIGGAAQRYISAPGLLEATLTIAITGPNPEDYTFTAVVAELRRPTTSQYCPFICGYPWYDIPNPAGGFFANAGDLCVLDIERHYRLPPGGTGVTPKWGVGDQDTMYSLKNLTTGLEINTFPGPTGENKSTIRTYFAGVMDFDMSTLSFVFSAQRFGDQPQGVAMVVFTFNQFREIFFPDNMPASTKATFTAAAPMDYRSNFLGPEWILMPLNDIPQWNDTADLNALREHIAWEMGFTTAAHPTPWKDDPDSNTTQQSNPVNVPTYARKAWFAAVSSAEVAYGLVYIDRPQFSWYAHADAIMSAMHKTPWSTFFVHQSGTWALFDQSRIFNYGNPNGTRVASFDVSKLEHFIVDRVHIEVPMSGGKVKKIDTTFMKLYNDAVNDGITNNTISDKDGFQQMTLANMRAVFTYGVHTAGQWTWLALQMLWDGVTYVFEDGGVNNQPTNFLTGLPLPPIVGGHQTDNLYVDSLWGNSSPQAAVQHKTFSSCLVIQ